MRGIKIIAKLRVELLELNSSGLLKASQPRFENPSSAVWRGKAETVQQM